MKTEPLDNRYERLEKHCADLEKNIQLLETAFCGLYVCLDELNVIPDGVFKKHNMHLIMSNLLQHSLSVRPKGNFAPEENNEDNN